MKLTHVITNFFLAVLAGLAFAVTAQAMTVEVHGNQIFATGRVDGDDFGRFETALSTAGVDTVVFVNSPGGDLRNGLRIARLIVAKGLNTVAAGYCISSCAIMFMGGKQRSFSDVLRPLGTYIGIHGAHNRSTKEVNPLPGPQIFAYFKSRMGERFNADLINTALYSMEDFTALLRVYDVGRLPKRTTYHCRSGQIPRSECTTFDGVDAVSLGVVTSDVLTHINLPNGFGTSAMIYGQELVQPLIDPPTFMRQVSARQCKSTACLRLYDTFIDGKDHKAIATSLAADTTSIAVNRESPLEAMLIAIARCNYPKGEPIRLCEPQFVNGFDVRDRTRNANASHQAALQSLTVPSEKFFANEDRGGETIVMNSLRAAPYRSMTPRRIDGIALIGTQELASALKGFQPPMLIDISRVGEAIPTSQKLEQGGQVITDAAKDAIFAEHFVGLLKLMSPDLSQPIVFYGQGREDWQAANAALRASKMGYTQVIWYRGGLDAWKAARLPVASVVLRGVAA